MKTLPPLVFFGSDDFSARMLGHLLEYDFFKTRLKYVVTKTPQKKGRGRVVTPTAVDVIAATIPNIVTIRANTKSELDEAIGQLETPLTGVLVSYGVIVSQFVLNRFEPGIINFHPSLLPLYRGPSPVETAILDGATETGVSVMKLEPAMDAGPVYAQKTLALRGTETPASLYERIASESADWFAEQLQAIFDAQLDPKPQDDSHATYTHIIKKQDGILRPDQKTATELERQIRAHQQFPKSRFTIHGSDLIITASHVVASPDASPLVIACTNNTFFAVDELIAPNGKKMTAEAYQRGYSKP
jgi:methionyl-tRNA formyltransferase